LPIDILAALLFHGLVICDIGLLRSISIVISLFIYEPSLGILRMSQEKSIAFFDFGFIFKVIRIKSYFQILMDNLTQGSQTHGLRAACGPLDVFVWPRHH